MTVVIANRQHRKKINARLLRQIATALLAELEIAEAELGLRLVAATEMARVNGTFLNHAGSTDVITFDHSKPETRNPKPETVLHGELFICLDDAIAQAREFRTTWQSEVVRYVIHGVLHLLGHDDHAATARRKMKREENRLLRRLAKEFPLARLAR
ncbi:MAG: rRNA maturation RNase YbeY [Verrucomicrobia bacterium]|nr:rRNA maturation RNase YbeY [Verrucomicrobiota bacterium]